jgi:hypothetical protein
MKFTLSNMLNSLCVLMKQQETEMQVEGEEGGAQRAKFIHLFDAGMDTGMICSTQ